MDAMGPHACATTPMDAMGPHVYIATAIGMDAIRPCTLPQVSYYRLPIYHGVDAIRPPTLCWYIHAWTRAAWDVVQRVVGPAPTVGSTARAQVTSQP